MYYLWFVVANINGRYAYFRARIFINNKKVAWSDVIETERAIAKMLKTKPEYVVTTGYKELA